MIKYYVQNEWEIFVRDFTADLSAGMPLFDLLRYGEYDAGKGYFTEGAELRGCQIFYTLDGEGELKYNGKTVPLIRNSIAIISCSEHFIYRTKGDNWHFYFIHFLGSSAHAVIRSINEDGIFAGIMGIDEFMLEFNAIRYHSKHRRKNTTLEVSLKIYSFMARILALKVSSDTNEYKKYEKTVSDICEYISHNLDKDLTIDHLAGFANISKFHFIRVFQNITGYTPHKYILLLQINMAKSLLNNEDLSIAEIAEKCYFGDSKNFILNFKKFTGTTPRKHRKENVYLS